MPKYSCPICIQATTNNFFIEFPQGLAGQIVLGFYKEWNSHIMLKMHNLLFMQIYKQFFLFFFSLLTNSYSIMTQENILFLQPYDYFDKFFLTQNKDRSFDFIFFTSQSCQLLEWNFRVRFFLICRG